VERVFGGVVGFADELAAAVFEERESGAEVVDLEGETGPGAFVVDVSFASAVDADGGSSDDDLAPDFHFERGDAAEEFFVETEAALVVVGEEGVERSDVAPKGRGVAESKSRRARSFFREFLFHPFADGFGEFFAWGEGGKGVFYEGAGEVGGLAGEGVEAVLASVAAVAALADAAEGEFEVGGLFDEVVVAVAASGELLRELFLEGFVCGEEIGGEGVGVKFK